MPRGIFLILTLLCSSTAAWSEPLLKDWVGSLEEVAPSQRRWFRQSQSFRVLSQPRGKTVEHYLSHRHSKPIGTRDTVVVRWLGSPDPRIDSVRLTRYLEAFFQLPVRIEYDPYFRFPKERERKLSAERLQEALLESLPEDAFALLGLTTRDLYSEDNGPAHLLFGQGHYYNRTAVAGLSRLQTDRTTLYYHRVFKLLTHELVHTFSVEHCGYFECLMNPSGSVVESDGRPLFLCPVCLRKIHAVLNFDVPTRYEELLEVGEAGQPEDLRWLRERLLEN